MKKIVLISIAFLFQQSINAQISLTYNAYSPAIGEAYLVYSYDSIASLNISYGENVNWDFSSNTSDTTGNYYISYTDPLNNSDAPIGTTLVENKNSTWTFLKNSTNKLEVLGYSDLVNKFNVPESEGITVRNWPLNYGDAYSDTGDGTYSSSLSNVPPTGSISPESKGKAVGYGTLKVPNGTTYTNVLLVVDTINYDISFHPSPNVTAGVGTTKIYNRFYSANSKFPIFNIIFNSELQYAINTDNMTTILWNNSKTYEIEYTSAVFVNSVASNSNLEIGIYPNPVTDKITINVQEQVAIDVLNINGAKIETLNLVSGMNHFDFSKYTNGIYLLKATNEAGKSSISKLIKE